LAGQCRKILSEIVPKEGLLGYDDIWCKFARYDHGQPKHDISLYRLQKPLCILAKDLIYELDDQFDVHLEWLPYTLDIPSYLGSARLDERGEVIESNRNGHQWRRVRYSYIDCRRQARKRGLVILGTRKI
jgi:hypothetical protein